MISYHEGDLLKSNCDVICHQVNLQGVMGGGLALQIARKFPQERFTSTFIKERDEKMIEYICQNIQKFIEDNNIDVCFVINQDEMLDCLKEHGKLKHEIEVLKFKEKNYLKQIKHLKQEQTSNHEHNLLVENLKSRIKQLEDVIRSMK